MTIVCWSVKGGSGTTVTATSLARVLADRHGSGALLVDTAGDALLVLGQEEVKTRGVRTWLASADDVSSDALDLLTIDAGRNLRVLPAGDVPSSPPTSTRWRELAGYLDRREQAVVVDLGTLSAPHRAGRRTLLESATTSLLVIRPCYLAVRRAIEFPVRPTGVILIREDDRSITGADVSAALGVPIVATVLVDARIARTVDAGLLGSRLPRPLMRAYRHVGA